jgi:hypothetical protein
MSPYAIAPVLAALAGRSVRQNFGTPLPCSLVEQNGPRRRSSARRMRPQWTGTGSKETGSRTKPARRPIRGIKTSPCNNRRSPDRSKLRCPRRAERLCLSVEPRGGARQISAIPRPRASFAGCRGLACRFPRRLAFDALALGRLGISHGLRSGPMTLRLAIGAAFVEPQKISNLTNAVVAISHCRFRVESCRPAQLRSIAPSSKEMS